MAGSLTEKEIIDLKDAFAILDTNNDGFLKKSEVKKILISIKKDGTDEQVARIIAEFDTDGDGVINFPEFLNKMTNCGGPVESEGQLKDMFNIIDRDGDGYITRTEMKRSLEEMSGTPVPHSEVDGMMLEADLDDDGKVSFCEFEAIMKQKHPGQFQ